MLLAFELDARCCVAHARDGGWDCTRHPRSLHPTLVGVVTDRDLCLHVVATGRDPAFTWVDACMTPEPGYCTERDDIGIALDLMKRHQIRRLPVVNEKHEVVGMSSLGDVLRKSGAEASAIAATLEYICAPDRGTTQEPARIIVSA